MGTHNLQYLFKPSSIAVIGASETPRRVGSVVMENLLRDHFKGPILPVNPNRQSIHGVMCYSSVSKLPIVPECAVICVSPARVPAAIKELGEKGTKGIILITAGLPQHIMPSGKTALDETVEIARTYEMRILGPNCVGMLVPPINLNSSFIHRGAEVGKLAFVSQSGAMCTAILDWATSHGIGFSHFISMGDVCDVDFGDVIDYLWSDPNTDSILLYIEHIHNARKFLSAARRCLKGSGLGKKSTGSQRKPIIAIKAGRSSAGAKAASSHTGALAGSDASYGAAFERAGILRVTSFEELFDAVETLGHKPDSSLCTVTDELTIVTNGGGIGVLCADALSDHNGKLVELSDDTISKLNAFLPATWSHGNPIDIIGDSGPDRYNNTLEVLLKAPEVGPILLIHAPVATVDTTELSKGITERIKQGVGKPITTCWVGKTAVEEGRRIFSENGIPVYETPEQAVRAFTHYVGFTRAEEVIKYNNTDVTAKVNVHPETVRASINEFLCRDTNVLDENTSKEIFEMYGIPVVKTHLAETPAQVGKFAELIGGPVVIKVISDDIIHKSDVGGVVLNLKTPREAEEAARKMEERIKISMPNAKVRGISVQKMMIPTSNSFELIIGATDDPTFGPIIMFGQGGTSVEIVKDNAVSLPPLNRDLSRSLVSRTRISKLMAGYRGHAAANIDGVYDVIARVSQLVSEIPEIMELDINPLFVDEDNVLALDGRIRVATKEETRTPMAIAPYPRHLEESITIDDDEYIIRPVKPSDFEEYKNLHTNTAPDDIKFRYFSQRAGNLTDEEIKRFTQIDYDREMAFVVQNIKTGELLGVDHIIFDMGARRGEFGIIIRSDVKRKGLGTILHDKIVKYCKERFGSMVLYADVLYDNKCMLYFAIKHGFRIIPNGQTGVDKVEFTIS